MGVAVAEDGLVVIEVMGGCVGGMDVSWAITEILESWKRDQNWNGINPMESKCYYIQKIMTHSGTTIKDQTICTS